MSDGECDNLSINTIAYNCGLNDSILSASIINIIDCSNQESPQVAWIDETQDLIDTDQNATVGWKYPRVIYTDISRIISELRESDEDDSQDLASQQTDPDPQEFNINGVCDNSAKNSCSLGTPNDIAIDDTNTHYTWHCEGLNGGTTATNCQAEKATTTTTQKIIGRCSGTRNSCAAGVFNNHPEDSNTHYRWTCRSIPHTSPNREASCNLPKLQAVNGRCNNTVNNGCSAGTANDAAITDTATLWNWHCVGSNGGNTATNCAKAKPQKIIGTCGTTKYSCTAGVYHNHPVDTNTHYLWTCRSIPHTSPNREASCSLPKPPAAVNGVCNNAVNNGCSKGTLRDLADTTTLYKWQCLGLNGGTTAIKCSKAKPVNPVNGVCNNAVNNGCSKGTLRDLADTTTLYKWQCLGLNGGTTAIKCSKAKPAAPINGACNNSVQNGCSKGTANDAAIADTPFYHRWHCEGANGGTTANCQILLIQQRVIPGTVKD